MSGKGDGMRFLRGLIRRRLPVAVRMDETDPSPRDMAGYLLQIAARLDERPEKMRVEIYAPAGTTLDLCEDGRMAVRIPGRKTHFFFMRRRWIADHPVPLPLFREGRRRKPAVLLIDPVDANRFRVRLPVFRRCAAPDALA